MSAFMSHEIFMAFQSQLYIRQVGLGIRCFFCAAQRPLKSNFVLRFKGIEFAKYTIITASRLDERGTEHFAQLQVKTF